MKRGSLLATAVCRGDGDGLHAPRRERVDRRRGRGPVGRHLQEVADVGGGLIVVYSGVQCADTSPKTRTMILNNLTDQLQAEGVPIVGLVVTDGVHAEMVRYVMEDADERFPTSIGTTSGSTTPKKIPEGVHYSDSPEAAAEWLAYWQEQERRDVLR